MGLSVGVCVGGWVCEYVGEWVCGCVGGCASGCEGLCGCVTGGVWVCVCVGGCVGWWVRDAERNMVRRRMESLWSEWVSSGFVEV